MRKLSGHGIFAMNGSGGRSMGLRGVFVIMVDCNVNKPFCRFCHGFCGDFPLLGLIKRAALCEVDLTLFGYQVGLWFFGQ
jgi:hypothetical protein